MSEEYDEETDKAFDDYLRNAKEHGFAIPKRMVRRIPSEELIKQVARAALDNKVIMSPLNC